MKYVALLILAFAVAACEKEPKSGYSEKELMSIEVKRDFEDLDKLANTPPPKGYKPGLGVKKSSDKTTEGASQK